MDCPEQIVLVTTPRGVGKTSGLSVNGINRYQATGKKFILLRRKLDDLNKSLDKFFSADINARANIENGTRDKRDLKVQFEADGAWHTAGIGMSLSMSEKYRGPDYSDFDFLFFDEFTTTGLYLPREVFRFLDLMETIFRKRNDIKIVLAGNQPITYCPYYDFLRPGKRVKHIDYRPPDSFMKMAEESPLYQATRGTAWNAYAYNNDYFSILKKAGLLYPGASHPGRTNAEVGGFKIRWLTQKKQYHISEVDKLREPNEQELKYLCKVLATSTVAFENTQTIYNISKLIPNTVEQYVSSFIDGTITWLNWVLTYSKIAIYYSYLTTSIKENQLMPKNICPICNCDLLLDCEKEAEVCIYCDKEAVMLEIPAYQRIDDDFGVWMELQNKRFQLQFERINAAITDINSSLKSAIDIK